VAGKYRDLIAWQKAMDLAERVYAATGHWPRDERFGLTQQTRRAAVSVPANIAEGHGRIGPRELLHHLSLAVGSLHEVETHLLLAERVRYLSPDHCAALLEQTSEVGRLLGGLMRSIQARGGDDRR
jgi:four helix bundle protein